MRSTKGEEAMGCRTTKARRGMHYTDPDGSFDLPKCQTIIIVRVCVKASPADGWQVSDTLRSESPPSSPEKRSILAPTPSSPPRELRQMTFPNVKNDAGQKQKVSVFVKASPAEGRRRLHKNTAYAHLWAEGPKAGV